MGEWVRESGVDLVADESFNLIVPAIMDLLWCGRICHGVGNSAFVLQEAVTPFKFLRARKM